MSDVREMVEVAIRDALAHPHNRGDLADAALAALDAAGWAVVPKEATEEMGFAGARQLVKSGAPIAKSVRIWAAMCAAAPKVAP